MSEHKPPLGSNVNGNTHRNPNPNHNPKRRRIGNFSRSLTVRLALLYALSTLLILASTSFYLLHVIDHHFVEQDMHEMQGKLELTSRLLVRSQADETLEFLPHHLDDALVGHHHLALSVFRNDSTVYTFGNTTFPTTLLAQAGTAMPVKGIVSWVEKGGAGGGAHQSAQHSTHQSAFRGMALRVAAADGAAPYVVAVALNVEHHREFIDNIKLALWVVFGLVALGATVLGWGVARVGLAPLRQTARLASEITAERLDTRLSADRIPPELTDLAVSFNAMLDRLRDSIERLSSFAADLAHEMRTPVSNLMMQTQVMLSQARSSDDYREVLASNLEEYERLARTISDMLFLAKADNGLIVPSHEEIDLHREVTELFDFYEALAEDSVINLELEGAARTSGDRLMLRRALSNLISNAIRYTPRGNAVHVRLSTRHPLVQIEIENPLENLVAPPLDPPLTTPSEKTADRSSNNRSSSDHLSSHLPADLERLFDRFYRADPSRRDATEGAGLGLAITRSIVRAHGGEVVAKPSTVGLCFTVTLPGLNVVTARGSH